MNAYLTDSLAREHADRLLADAAAARRARGVRMARSAARTSRTDSAADRSPAAPRSRAAAAAHLALRPATAFHSWWAAGEL